MDSQEILNKCIEVHPEYLNTDEYKGIQDEYDMGLITHEECCNQHIDAMVRLYGTITFNTSPQ